MACTPATTKTQAEYQQPVNVLEKRARSTHNIPSPSPRRLRTSTRANQIIKESHSALKEAALKNKKENNPRFIVSPPITPSKKRAIADIRYTSVSPPSATTPSKRMLLSPPQTPSTPTIYSGAKSVFQRSASSTAPLLCRDSERQIIESFINTHVEKRTSGCLYVSGPPGTGKSALTSEVVHRVVKADNTIRVNNVNCVTVRKPALVISKIVEDITGEAIEEVDHKHASAKLEAFFANSSKSRGAEHQSCIVILDEMDYLITKDQGVIYEIFEWTRLQHSSLILIGIANALNLTTRFLPKLKARNFVPELLRFNPYTAEQIAQVLKARMDSYLETVQDEQTKFSVTGLLHPAAIQLCARKTAANTGDLRKAFDICKRGLDLAEEEARRKYSIGAPTNGICSPSSKSSLTFTIPAGLPAPKVTIAHIAKICSYAFGGSTVQRIQTLNLQQKAVLCALVVGEKRKNASLTVGELYEQYGTLCARDKLLDSLQISEYREVISALEACGAVSLSSGVAAGKSVIVNRDGQRISASVQEIDLLRAVQDVGMLKRFFSDDR
ncbi:P-loop containing nucleoside triphosphate hydrolase protein [Kockiozyma suomiensis]|uniref:P-loop containing nucleoside triphosphate hydrolase protein n=1 Tax=Kockiozyma suomiensis TaxID=1337062 RepID=UPI00334343CF